MRKGSITLCFFVDALGWELARRHRCFEAIAPHAYRQRTVLGYSCAAQPTILTGLMPVDHGHWAMYMKTGRSEMASLRHLRLLPLALTDRGRFRRQVLRFHKRTSGFSGYYNLYRIPFDLFAHFDACEKRDIFAPNAFAPGVASIFDVLRAEEVSYQSWSWKTSLDDSFAELEAAIASETDLRFALLYTPYIDAFLHGHIGDDGAVAGALKDVERRIARAVELAREAYSDVEIIIYSDHGMTPTTGTCDVMRAIDGLGLSRHTDYIAFYDSTMARFWFLNDDARVRVIETLDGLEAGSVLPDERLHEEGILFEDGRFGELVFLMDPGTLILPSFMGKSVPKGMHGFSPDHEDSYAVIMSDRPVDPAPTHIRDTFAVMRRSVE
jgi:hypothetical protein